MSRSEAKQDATALLVILVCVIVAFWKIALTSQYTFVEHPDIGPQVLPWLQVQASALRHGSVALWDPFIFGGQPLAGQVQPAVFSPFTWILLLGPLDPSGHLQLRWVDSWFVLLHILAGCFAYVFLRTLPASRPASVVGAVFFGAGGFVGNTLWPQIAGAAIWLPLMFLHYLRSLRGERPIRSAIFAGGFLALSLLAGHHAVPTFAALALAGTSAAAAIMGSLPWPKALLRMTVTFVVAALGAAIQILPAIEYGHYAVRWVNTANPVDWSTVVPYPAHQMLGWNASELLFLVLPGSNAITNPIIGIVPMALALVSIFAGTRRRDTALFGGLALGMVLFSLARFNLFHGVLYALVPGLEKARAPIMAMAITSVAVAALAAQGVDALLSCSVPRLTRLCAGLGGVALVLFAMSLYPPAILTHVPFGTDRAAMIAGVAGLLALLLSAWQRQLIPALALTGGLLVVALIEIGNSTTFDYLQVEDKAAVLRPRLYGGTEDLAAFLRERLGDSRIHYAYDDLIFNFGDWYGIPAMSGYVPSTLETVWRLGWWDPRVLDLYGVRYYIGRQPPQDGGREVFTSSGGWKIWERATALPRVWSVHRVISARSFDEAQRIVRDPSTNLLETVVLEHDVTLESCSDTGRMETTGIDTSRVVIDSVLACAGLVVVSDNWFPGWQATLDGKPVEILKADAALRAIRVPGGRHRIEMNYRPASVKWGAAISFVTLLGLTATTVFGRKRQEKADSPSATTRIVSG